MPTENTRDAPEQVIEMKLTELHPFKNHPFKVLDDELMQQTIDSILQVGVLSPAVVRPDPNGGYEVIAGHRRLHACKAAGLDTMPVIVKELSDDEAVITMVDSNLQRENILPSERAKAYKMKAEALKYQGKRDKSRGCKKTLAFLYTKTTETIEATVVLWYNVGMTVQTNTVHNCTPIQMKFQVGFETIIEINDPIYSFNEIVNQIDLRKYFVGKGNKWVDRDLIVSRC